MTSLAPDDARIDAARRFARFYTRRIGALHEGLLDSPFTLTESRLLWELAHHEHCSAATLARELDLDPATSRLLRAWKERGLVRSTRSAQDARIAELSLSAAGRRAFEPLEQRSRTQMQALLARLDDGQQQQVLRSMAQIERARRQRRPRAAGLRAACPPPGRHRLDHRPPRGALCAGVRLRQPLRGDGGAHRRRLPRAFRSGARSLLDRRARRRQRRLRGPGACGETTRPGRVIGPRRSCACCWSSRPRAASVWASGSRPSANVSHATSATGASCCGPMPA